MYLYISTKPTTIWSLKYLFPSALVKAPHTQRSVHKGYIPVYREKSTRTKQGGGRYSTTPIP